MTGSDLIMLAPWILFGAALGAVSPAFRAAGGLADLLQERVAVRVAGQRGSGG